MTKNPKKTQLFAGIVVDKSVPRLALRGKLDSIHALAMSIDVRDYDGNINHIPIVISDMQELCAHIGSLQIYEATDGRTVQDNVKRLIEPSDVVVPFCGARTKLARNLNVLRTQIREVELMAWSIDNVLYETIGIALNRLSQYVAIMMKNVDDNEYYEKVLRGKVLYDPFCPDGGYERVLDDQPDCREK